MLYNPPSGSTDPAAPYIPKNVAAGIQGSKVPPAAIEYTQREIVAAISAGGQAPTNAVLTQLAQSLARGVWLGAFTGTGDLPVGTLGCVFPALLQGMRVRGVTSAANTVTNPKLRVVGIGTPTGSVDFPILKEDGSSLAIGEMKPNKRYTYESDGAGNVMISGGGIGTGSAAVTSVLDDRKIVGGNILRFNANGTWTCPAGITRAFVETQAPGGGGGGAYDGSAVAAAAGGGGGEFRLGTLTVVPGTVYAITVSAPGSPGSGSSSPTSGGNGGVVSFGSLMTALGGVGGAGALNGVQTSILGLGGTGGAGGDDSVDGANGGAAYLLGSGNLGGGIGGASANASINSLNVNGTGASGRTGGGGGTGGSSITSGGGAPGGQGGAGWLRLRW